MHYCRRKLKENHYDYFLFGHRHLPLQLPIGEASEYINTGDWIYHNTYAVFTGEQLKLEKWERTDD